MRRWQVWGCGLIALGFCGFGVAVLFPIFASAEAASRMTPEEQAIRSFRLALIGFADQNGGRLPGRTWKKAILALDPTIADLLEKREDGCSGGLAAISGTQGKRLDDLPGDTILFVGYRSTTSSEILRHVQDIGDTHGRQNTLMVTAENVRSGGGRDRLSDAEIGFRLAKQEAPGLD